MRRKSILAGTFFGVFWGLMISAIAAAFIDNYSGRKTLGIVALGIGVGSCIGAVAGWIKGDLHRFLFAEPESTKPEPPTATLVDEP